MARAFCILTVVVASLILAANASESRRNSELKQFLLKDYDKDVNPDSQVSVSITMYLVGIRTEQEDTTFVTLTGLYWVDPRLTWNPADFNTFRIRLSSDLIWIPDISNYNGRSQVQTRLVTRHTEYTTVIYANGGVLYVPPVEYEANCEPMEQSSTQHNCSVILSSWAFDKSTVDIQTPPDTGIVLDFFSSHKYEVLDALTSLEEKTYPCCPGEVYPDITFNVIFHEKDQPLNKK